MWEPGKRRVIGTLPGGPAVEAVTLAAGDLRADVMTWGAVVRDLRLDGADWPLVLGFDSLDAYPEHSRFFGATAGRYANRIADGQFQLDGKTYQLERNYLGRHHLHGGSASFGTRPWNLTSASERSVTLELISPDGDGGYPGEVHTICVIEIAAPSTMTVRYEARTTASTVFNLAHHSYFNLDGSPDILNHHLMVNAETYLPVDETLIPTGEILPVAGTIFDFRRTRMIGDPPGAGVLYDHNYCLSREPVKDPRFCAELRGESGLTLRVSTTEPGLQFYDGSGLDVPVPGLEGRRYGPRAGLCLEPQRWPDSPNRAGFSDATLRPETPYRQVTEFEFAA